MTCYRIKDYEDGDLLGCVDCDAADPEIPVWQGTFPVPQGSITLGWWPAATPGVLRINGKMLGTGTFTTYVRCYVSIWDLHITCRNEDPIETFVIWYGGKSWSPNPCGIYTREGGCDETATLEIEECP